MNSGLPKKETVLMDSKPMPWSEMSDATPNDLDDVPFAELSGEDDRPVRWWVRLGLVGVAAGLILVFAIGACLRPYEADGTPKTHGTHQQLGLPPCSFNAATGWPCPSCGFTTCFSLVAHGDFANAFRVNSVGTLFALYCLGLIPWALVSAYRRRVYWVRSVEKFAVVSLIVMVTLMLGRWAILIGWNYLRGQS
jgi:hypothetical protein